jgi:hypothetical protein
MASIASLSAVFFFLALQDRFLKLSCLEIPASNAGDDLLFVVFVVSLLFLVFPFAQRCEFIFFIFFVDRSEAPSTSRLCAVSCRVKRGVLMAIRPEGRLFEFVFDASAVLDGVEHRTRAGAIEASNLGWVVEIGHSQEVSGKESCECVDTHFRPRLIIDICACIQHNKDAIRAFLEQHFQLTAEERISFVFTKTQTPQEEQDS